MIVLFDDGLHKLGRADTSGARRPIVDVALVQTHHGSGLVLFFEAIEKERSKQGAAVAIGPRVGDDQFFRCPAGGYTKE